jgi:hypothetical protein
MSSDKPSAVNSRQARRSRSATGGLLYFLVLATPSIPMYFGFATSFTLGFAILALGLVIYQASRHVRRLRHAPAPLEDVHLVAFAALTGITLHLALAALLLPVDLARATPSLIALALLLLGGGVLANQLDAIPDAKLNRGLLGCYYALCGLAVLSLLGLAVPSAVEWRRPVFPFTEPSHFAVAFSTAMLYTSVKTKGLARGLCITAGLLVAVLLQNLTLTIGCILVGLTTVRVRSLVLLLVPLLFLLPELDLSYYADRLDLSGDVQNLSNLVYLQGWQMIQEAWVKSHGFGIGFQQLGVAGTEVPASDLLRALREGEDINLLDGGFVFAKMAADFGAVGILLGLGYIILAIRSFLVLRRSAIQRMRLSAALAMGHCAVLSYVLELFIRGGGYFTGGSLLLVAGLWLTAAATRRTSSLGPPMDDVRHGAALPA